MRGNIQIGGSVMQRRDTSKLFVFTNVKIIRLVLGIIILFGILSYTIFYSLAGFSGIAQNKNNKITTANMSMDLLTTDKPINILPNSNGESLPAPLPQTIADLFANGNTLISIDDGNSENRKFFEYQGKSEITDIQPGFRQQRPLIVQNKSNVEIEYTIEFITREILNPGLSKVFFFHYVKVGDDIANDSIVPDNQTLLTPGILVENIGSPIQKIGHNRPVRIQPNATHIYIVDMGILSTAGNAVQGAGMYFDIVLNSVCVGKGKDSISEQSSAPSNTVSDSPTPQPSSSASSDITSSLPPASSDNDPFYNYIDYNLLHNETAYGGGNGTVSNPYLINNLSQFKHFIEDTTTTKNTWVKINISIARIKNIPSTVLTKKAKIIIGEAVYITYLDINANPPSVNPLNPFQLCDFFVFGSATTEYYLFFNEISYRGEFVN